MFLQGRGKLDGLCRFHMRSSMIRMVWLSFFGTVALSKGAYGFLSREENRLYPVRELAQRNM